MIGIEDLVWRMVELTRRGESAETILALVERDLSEVQDLQQTAQVRAALISEYSAEIPHGPVRDEIVSRLGALTTK